MKSLDEAIRYYEETAKDHEIVSEDHKDIVDGYRQLAGWLKELKCYREIKDSWNRLFPNGEEVNDDEDSD